MEYNKKIGRATYSMVVIISALIAVYALMFGTVDLIENYSEPKLILWLGLLAMSELFIHTFNQNKKLEKKIEELSNN